MMSTAFFRQPRLVLLSILVIVSAGMSAFLSIGRQEDPTITNLFATVTTLYPGAEPARVETLVTETIETELREISSIAVVESQSGSGVSIISIELQESLDDADIEVAWTDVRSALDDAATELPAGALTPEFTTGSAGAFSSIVALRPAADMPLDTTQRFAKALADKLRRLSGTDTVQLFGTVEEEVLIEIDGTLLTEFGLSVDQIAAAINNADTKVRAGRVRTPQNEMVIELAANVDSLEQIRALPVALQGTAVTRLGDIASVKKTYRQPAEELAMVGGEPAILVASRINQDLQIDVWMGEVSEVLDAFEAQLPVNITLERLFDQSAYTYERLSDVASNMAIGVLLVVLVLFLTLGVRAALIVAMVLPLVTLASIATMNFIGIPIHQMSLTGLIVALGLLVDAAIVMTDDIGRRLKAGLARLDAVERSVKRLFAPLLASTITTALSFLPMVLLDGPAGDFVGSIALSVIIMLVWSFLVAMTITAATAARWLPLSDSDHRPACVISSGLSLALVTQPFKRSLELAVRHPLLSLLLALVLPVAGFIGSMSLTAQFFPGVDRDQFYIEVELAEGSAIGQTRQTAIAIEDILDNTAGITQVAWVIGKSAPSFYYNMVSNKDQAPEFAQALVKTTSPEDTARIIPELQNTLNAHITEARVLVRALVQGPPVDAPVEVRLLGPSLDVLKEEGTRLRALMSEMDVITATRTSLDGGAPKVVVNVDEQNARMAGLSLSSIARQLEATLEGQTGGSMLDGTELLPIRVRANDAFRRDLTGISNLALIPDTPTQADGVTQTVPLSAIATVELKPANSDISRRNGERVNTVQAFVRYGVLPEEALKDVKAAMEATNHSLPNGYRLQLGGDSDARDSTLNGLLASLGIIITLSVATIVMTFNSFRLALVTFIVAGLSAGLSMLALAVFNYPFGINAIIGVIGSIGVSVNAAIVILTALQAHPAASRGSCEGMVEVVMGSSRHIVSTTITTFGGFLPLILSGGGFWPPFAMAIGGGVLLSSVISFYFTPPMYRLMYARQWARQRKADMHHPEERRDRQKPSIVLAN